MFGGAPFEAWVLFHLMILAMLAMDLGVFNRRNHDMKMKEALAWSGVWVGISFALGTAIYFWHGEEAALSFAAGYLIEKALSVDNLFVFISIFSFFGIAHRYQHKILVWGVLGALILRGVFIFSGVLLIEKLHWVLYIFGGFLILTGIKLAIQKDHELHPEKNPILKLVGYLFPIDKKTNDGRFFTQVSGRRAATPLFVTLILIETTDLLFAVDSIPAVLAITSDPFLIYTSNVCAILGLRSLFFVVSGAMNKFDYLKYGLSAILVFVGTKMLAKDFLDIPVTGSLGVIVGLLATSIFTSMWADRK